MIQILGVLWTSCSSSSVIFTSGKSIKGDPRAHDCSMQSPGIHNLHEHVWSTCNGISQERHSKPVFLKMMWMSVKSSLSWVSYFCTSGTYQQVYGVISMFSARNLKITSLLAGYTLLRHKLPQPPTSSKRTLYSKMDVQFNSMLPLQRAASSVLLCVCLLFSIICRFPQTSFDS